MAQEESRLPAAIRRLRLVGRGAALAALAVGVTEIVGAGGGIDRLTAPVSGRPPMSGTAAVAFTVAALAMVVDRPSASVERRAARDALGAAAAAIGLGALADAALDAWPGIGMPSVPASIALIVFGVAVVLLDRAAGGKRPADALGAVVGFVGLVTLLGHANSAPQLYTSTDHGTSLAGSICMCLLAVAVLCARPDEGIVSLAASPTSGGITARRLGLAALILIPGLGLVVALAQRALGLEERSVFAVVIATATTLSLAVIAFTSTDLDSSDRELKRAIAAERALHTQIEALSRASDAMSEAVARMEGSDVTLVLREIAEQTRLAAGAEYAALGIASEDEPGTFAQLVTAGVPESVLETLRGLGAPRTTGVLGDVVLRGKSIRTRLVSEHPDARGMPANHPPIKALLGVPVSFAGSQIGSLFLGNKRDGDEFTADDQRMVEMLAARAASALRAAQLHEVEARAHEWLQTVINQMPEPMLITDADGTVLNWNRAAIAMGGPDGGVDEEGNPTVLDIRLPSGAAVPTRDLPISMALDREETVTGVELSLRAPDGTSRPVMASAAPLRDMDGRLRGAVALFDDITVLKQLERMREEWTAVIAHDLRQPLNGIVLHAQVLRRGLGAGATERQLESIEHIRIAGLRLNRMIEDLLDATRIEASRLKLERRSMGLALLVRQIVERMPELSGRAVAVEEQGEVPEVFVDATRVEQVVSNLLSNAAKYGDTAGPIEVRIVREEAEVHVAVSNEGSELGAAELSHLFTRFYRTPSAEAGPKRGIGLGLYITKGLVEAHGGRIWAESRERRTTFHFTLPPANGPMASVADEVAQ